MPVLHADETIVPKHGPNSQGGSWNVENWKNSKSEINIQHKLTFMFLKLKFEWTW